MLSKLGTCERSFQDELLCVIHGSTLECGYDLSCIAIELHNGGHERKATGKADDDLLHVRKW